MEGLDTALVQDLADAFEAKGGVGGAGPDYWSRALGADFPRIQSTAEGQGGLAQCLTELASTRHLAFRRSILWPDEASWGLPVLGAIVLMRAESELSAQVYVPSLPQHMQRVRELQPSDYAHRLEQMNRLRRVAAEIDRIPLLRYGSLMQAYVRRLKEIATALGGQPKIDAETVPDFATLTKPILSAQKGGAEVVELRKRHDAQEVQGMLRALFMVGSDPPAVRQAAAVSAAVIQAMAEDSHQAQKTSGLHPSPSLPSACYRPASYVRAPARGKQSSPEKNSEDLSGQQSSGLPESQPDVMDTTDSHCCDDAGGV